MSSSFFVRPTAAASSATLELGSGDVDQPPVPERRQQMVLEPERRSRNVDGLTARSSATERSHSSAVRSVK
jgi:hypothetical protein